MVEVEQSTLYEALMSFYKSLKVLYMEQISNDAANPLINMELSANSVDS